MLSKATSATAVLPITKFDLLSNQKANGFTLGKVPHFEWRHFDFGLPARTSTRHSYPDCNFNSCSIDSRQHILTTTTEKVVNS